MKEKWTYTPTQYALLIISVSSMPLVAVIFLDIDSVLWVGYIALWFTIMMQFAWLNIKLRKYREYYWEPNQSLTQEEK